MYAPVGSHRFIPGFRSTTWRPYCPIVFMQHLGLCRIREDTRLCNDCRKQLSIETWSWVCPDAAPKTISCRYGPFKKCTECILSFAVF
ncbi:hypothetical protein BDN72DRAFT_393422 [Pluteus cervinus]|uniref:Uncharacterized protein n=1 Tax=Pluteus cervinus TaxID=181527 RepID=A0ACD3ABZ3_9AGAR|nr:hypothetical protein BDN72DRAFT_393422 [Pluteus cervinus]